MHLKSALGATVGGAICLSLAVAQTTPTPSPGPTLATHFSNGDGQGPFVQMCEDQYPRAAGALAYLETKLDLADAQRPAFNRWKAVMLAAAKARAADCAGRRFSGSPPSAINRLKNEERMLRARLDDIQAQLPAMVALYGKLSNDQKEIMDRSALMDLPGGEPPMLIIRHRDVEPDRMPPDTPLPRVAP